MAKKSKNRKPVVQFVEYMISGGVYFWVGYAILNYLYYGRDWKSGALFWWATIISNVVGWAVNFILQRYWVFNNKSLKKNQTQVTRRYIFITLVDFVLNYFILFGLKQIHITPAIGQFISSGFFTVWNWFWYRLWVFPEHMKKPKTIVTPARVVAHRAHGHVAYHRAQV
jgi:putative flippase GtrA